jgi:asparagine N-glycosylation enzyme membrane subunit Stt3
LVWDLLAFIWVQPITVSSNAAREQAQWLAFAASMGWISTITPDGSQATRSWHLTKEGLLALETSTPR